MDALWRILATLALVALNGYFVAVEFLSVTARKSLLESRADDSIFARIALSVKQNLNLYLSAAQLGVTLASLGLGAVMEPAIGALIEPILHPFDLRAATQRLISFTFAYAIGTALGGVAGPIVFGHLIASGDRGEVFMGYALGGGLMLAAAVVALFLAIDSERRSLEAVAAPLALCKTE